MRIFVDMDGTLAKWNNVEFEQLFEEGYYRNLEPNKELLNEVNDLIRLGEDVYILSAYLTESKYAKKEKEEWVKQYLPELKEEKQIFVPYGTNKAEYLKEHYSPITNKDYLVDDYTKNLLEWKEMGGIGIKYLNGINHTKGTWNGIMINEHYSEKNKKLSSTLKMLILSEKIREAGLSLISVEEGGFYQFWIAQKDKIYTFPIVNNKFYTLDTYSSLIKKMVSPSYKFNLDIGRHRVYDPSDNYCNPPLDIKLKLSQYYARHYPILSQCTDFHLLIEHCNSNTLDNMEYTLYLYENTKAITFNNDGMSFNKGYEYLEENSRISFIYIDWYENIIETKDLINEVQLNAIANNNNINNCEAINEVMDFITNEEPEEPDICDEK